MENPRAWLHSEETAREFLSRVFTERPLVLLPPLHRVPLRAGNVVEIVGPSPSAKSQILLQAVVNCILPKEWKGVHFGGLERMVVYFDLDCRFDVLRLADVLKHWILDASGSAHGTCWGSYGDSRKHDPMDAQIGHYDNELLLACMRRLLYIRCYNSFEFLAALKTMRYKLQKESETLGIGIHFLMIDSIGAFHSIDRAIQPLPQRDSKRKNLSLQSIVETVVLEIRNLLQVQPLLVLATKATMFGSGTSELPRAPGKWSSEEMANTRISRGEKENLSYREFMPFVWQTFVTHRIHLGVSDGKEPGVLPTYTSEWVQPPLNILDRFTVRDNGIFMIS